MVFEDAGAPALGTPDAAVVEDPDASYERAGLLPVIDDEREQAVVAAQLGRRSRAPSAAAHRCAHGLPTVLRVAPRLDDGTPFPTTFWLSCPLVRAAVGRMESEQAMVEHNRRLGTDQDLADSYAAAAERLVAFRDELGGPLPGDPAAGGMPDHVKCLHAAVAQHLAVDDNPVGSDAFAQLRPVPCHEPCVPDVDDAVAAWGPDGSEVR